MEEADRADWFDFSCGSKVCNGLGTKACGRCLNTRYCSESCQLQHWKEEHKAKCRQLKNTRVDILKCLHPRIRSFCRITNQVLDLWNAFMIFARVNLVEPRPLPDLNPRLSVIENILNINEASTCVGGYVSAIDENEIAKNNAYRLAAVCLQIISFPYNQFSPRIAFFERCFSITQGCFEFLQQFWSVGLATIPTDHEELHNYKLFQVQFICEKGVLNMRKSRFQDAVGYLVRAVEIGKQNSTDVEFWNIQARATVNLATAYQQLNELSKAQYLLEDLYEKLCIKTGPGSTTVQHIALALADIYKMQGDNENSDYFMTVTHESILNSDEYKDKRWALVPVLLCRGKALYDRATQENTTLVGEEERRAMLLKAEDFAKEAVGFGIKGTHTMRKDLLQLLVNVMLVRGILYEQTLYNALTELVGILRQYPTPGNKERLELGNALYSAAVLTKRRVEEDERLAAVNSGPLKPSFEKRRLDVLEVLMGAFQELLVAFRIIIEAIEIYVTEGKWGLHQLAVPRSRNSEMSEISASSCLNDLFVVADKLVTVQLQVTSSSSTGATIGYSHDWICALRVEEGGLDSVDKSERSESVLIRRALAYWAVGKALQLRLHRATANTLASVAVSPSVPGAEGLSSGPTSVKATHGAATEIASNTEISLEKVAAEVSTDNVTARLAISEGGDQELLGPQASASRSEIAAALSMEIDRVQGLSRDILTTIDSAAELRVDLDRESASFDPKKSYF